MKIIDVVDAYKIDFELALFHIGQMNPKAKMEEFQVLKNDSKTKIFVIFEGNINLVKLIQTLKDNYGLKLIY